MTSRERALAVYEAATPASSQTSQAQTLQAQAPQLRPELLVEFCRALIQQNPNRDLFSLCLTEAQRASGATDKEVRLFEQAVLREADNSPWPKGFF